MLAPLPTGTGKIAQELREVRAELQRRAPVRTPGILTSVTSAGTTRKPRQQSSTTTTTQQSGYIAVWL